VSTKREKKNKKETFPRASIVIMYSALHLRIPVSSSISGRERERECVCVCVCEVLWGENV
jgi:hypothetical protein